MLRPVDADALSGSALLPGRSGAIVAAESVPTKRSMGADPKQWILLPEYIGYAITALLACRELEFLGLVKRGVDFWAARVGARGEAVERPSGVCY